MDLPLNLDIETENLKAAPSLYCKIILPKSSIYELIDKLGCYGWESCFGEINWTAEGPFKIIFKILKDNIAYFSKLVTVKTNTFNHNNSIKERLILLHLFQF